MQAGVLALTSISLAILLSVRLIRNKFFEAFLVAHVFLVGLFIVGAYIHARENE
jgi:ferric-chelate reductase